MNFGFSYVGLIYLLMLFIPNILWTRKKPSDYEKYVVEENKLLLVFERTGEILTCFFVLIFSNFNLREWTLWGIWLCASFILMVLYELYWVRYFKSAKTINDFYRSFIGIKVPGASLPVAAFFFLGIYAVNFPLIISSVILGIGHIGIHLGHAKSVLEQKKKNIFAAIGKGILVTLSVLFFGFTSFSILMQNINSFKHHIKYVNGIEEETTVNVCNHRFYVQATGTDVSNPVIVYLHGGPGGADTMTDYVFSDYLTDEYIFLCFDQRGCGRTYYKNFREDPLNQAVTFQQSLEDLDELVDYACRRFNKEKVIIMGHSYGTVLGSRYCISHPEKVSAYVGIGQFVSEYEGEMYSCEDALKKSAAAGDDTSLIKNALESYMNDRTDIMKMLSLDMLVSKYHPQEITGNSFMQSVSSPYLSVDGTKWFLKMAVNLPEYISLNRKLFDYVSSYDYKKFSTDYQMPVLFISGSDDWTCPVELTEQYKEIISAPEKEMVLLKGCGHGCQNDNPKEFAENVKKFLNKIR